jgi:ATP-binding cassette subfamily B protein
MADGRDDRVLGGPSNGPGLARLLRAALEQHKGALGHAFLLGLIGAAVGIAPPLLTGMLLDRVIPYRAGGQLVAVAAMLVVAAVLRALTDRLRAGILLFVETSVVAAIVPEVLGRQLAQPFERVNAAPTGVLVESLVHTEQLARTLPGRLLTLATEVPAVIALLAMLGLRHPAIALVALGGVALSGAASLLVAPSLGRAGHALIDAARLAQSRLFEALRGASAIRASGGQDLLRARWFGSHLDERVAELRRSRLESGSIFVAELAQRTTMFGALALAVWAGITGGSSPGDVVATIGLAAALTQSWNLLARVATDLIGSLPTLRKVDELIAAPPSAASRPPARSVTDEDAIVFDEVWFRYSTENPWAIRGQSFRIARGAVTLIRGESGAGKSTVLRLAAGLIRPERGGIIVLGDEAHAEMRQVRYLPQNAILVEGTVRRNLEVLSGATWPRVLEAARKTGLASWAESLPMKLETILAARGANLSGGERQLILLTAIVASDSPLVLLDEPFANMDPRLQANLDLTELFPVRTVVCVTHEVRPLARSRAATLLL